MNVSPASLRRLLAPALVLPLLLAGACAKQKKPKAPVDLGIAELAQSLQGGARNNVDPATPWLDINGVVVSLGDLNREINRMLAGLRVQATPEMLREQGQAIRQRAEQGLINRVLLLEEAKRRELLAPLSAVQIELDKLRTNLPQNVSLEQFLTQRQQSQEEFLRELRDDLTLARVQEKLSAAATPPNEDDLLAYFEANEDKLVQPEARRVRHLFKAFGPGMTPADRSNLVERVNRMRDTVLANPADFESLVRRHSDHPDKENGGIAVITQGQFGPAFDRMVFNLSVGSISDVLVDARQGIHLMQVMESLPGRPLPFPEIKEQLRAQLTEQRQRDILQREVARLRQAAEIKPLYETAPAKATP